MKKLLKLWWMAVPLVFITGSAIADYAATQGAGTNFASIPLASVHYMTNMLCDMTVGKTQCATVNGSGQVSITGPVTQSGAWNVGQTGTWTQRLQDGSGNAISSTSGSLNVQVSNTNANGQTTMSASSPVVIASDQTPIKVASTTGNIAANNTTGVNLKGSAGMVTSIQLGGIGSAPAYLKLYNKATAPTCGTDTPVKRLIIPAAATAANGAGSNVTFAYAITFSLGIGYCVTTGITDADTTAPAASTYLVNIDWQ